MAIKVNDIHNSGREIRKTGAKEPRSVQNEKQLAFHRTLSDASTQKQREYLEDMVDKIGVQGKKLTERVDLAEFERYRNMIRDFMNEIVNGGYEYSKETAYGARGRQKKIGTVKTVNEELDALAKDVLESEADNLKILERTGMIHGLLLDLLV